MHQFVVLYKGETGNVVPLLGAGSIKEVGEGRLTLAQHDDIDGLGEQVIAGFLYVRPTGDDQQLRAQGFHLTHQVEEFRSVPGVYRKAHHRLQSRCDSGLGAGQFIALPLLQPLGNLLRVIDKVHQLDIHRVRIIAQFLIISLEATRGHRGCGERVGIQR